MREFGVRFPSEFLAHLLPQGAWARCSACAIRRRALCGQQGAQLGGDNVTAALQRQIASAATQQCAQCREIKPKSVNTLIMCPMHTDTHGPSVPIHTVPKDKDTTALSTMMMSTRAQ